MHEVPSCVKQKIIPMPQKIPVRGGIYTKWQCFRWQHPLPAFPRAAGQTIRFWTFPSRGSSREVKSLVRQPGNPVMFPLPSTSGRVVHVTLPFWPLRALPRTLW
jgi:hypothetical protein